MKTPDVSKIKIKPNYYLVKRIPDYFARKVTEGPNFQTSDNENFSVGVILKAGSDIDQDETGHVIYYMKNLADVIKYKGVDTLEHVSLDFMLSVRMDQDKDNY